MPSTLRDTYNKIENLRGKKLLYFVVPLFLSFLFLGIIIGNFIPRNLNQDELAVEDTQPTEVLINESKQYEGRVVYVDPRFYPLDDISYYLEDGQGKEIVLLQAQDEKLAVVEGLNVVIFGDLQKTNDGENDVLMVERIVVKNN